MNISLMRSNQIIVSLLSLICSYNSLFVFTGKAIDVDILNMLIVIYLEIYFSEVIYQWQ